MDLAMQYNISGRYTPRRISVLPTEVPISQELHILVNRMSAPSLER